jgi:hypothetical protein
MKTSGRIFIKSASMGIAFGSYSGVFGSLGNQKQMAGKEVDERIKIGLSSFTFRP